MGFTAYPAALEPHLVTDTFQQTMEPGTDICKSAKNCPVSQLYLSALNQAVAVQGAAVPTNILPKRKKGQPGTSLPPAQKWGPPLLPAGCPHLRSSSRSAEATGALKGTSQSHLQSTTQVKRSSGVPSPGSVASLGENKTKTKDSKRSKSQIKKKKVSFSHVSFYFCALHVVILGLHFLYPGCGF